MNVGICSKGFHIGHLNIQGFRGKVDQVKLLLTSPNNNIHLFGLSETMLTENQGENFLYINGYEKPFRKDRKAGGGGLLVYVKTGSICKRREDLEIQEIESICLQITPEKAKPYLVGFVYRPPSSHTDWCEYFELQVDKISNEEKEFYILGDINRDLLNDQIKGNWMKFIDSLGMEQLVNEPTRVTSTSKTLIDHIYTNTKENILEVMVPKIGLSDHFPIFLTRKVNGKSTKNNAHKSIIYRSFQNFDTFKFLEDLEQIPWNTVHIFENIDDVLDAWTDLFISIVDKHAPLKTHRIKKDHQPGWISPEILEAIKQRDKLKSVGNQTEYRVWRNKVHKMILQAKQAHYKKVLDENQNNPKAIWKVFTGFGAGKCKRKAEILSLNHEGIYTDNPKDISDIFNNFFVQIAETLKEPGTSSDHMELKHFCAKKLQNNIKFEIPEMSPEFVLKYIKTMDVSKATGLDMIGPRLLKVAAPAIAESIVSICNESIRSNKFPQTWKTAKVIPLHKAGTKYDVNNYRPISILPCLSKLLEKHVHDSFLNYLNTYDLIHDNQSGFRQNHSCETALVSLIDKWLKALDQGEMVGTIMVDFRKAFDLVDHTILLEKLKIYQCSENSLNWFTSYLTDRVQKVSVNGQLSESKSINYGVPQGSILGPLLFILFINDLPLKIGTSISSTDLYADDTTLSEIGKTKTVLENNLQDALNRLQVWCKENSMIINTEKTKALLVTTQQKRARLDSDKLNVFYDNMSLKMTSQDKILGVFVDNNLTWSTHIKHISKKVNSYLWLLRKIKSYIPLQYRVIFYKSYIQPYLDYCNIIWGNTSNSNITTLIRLQKRACHLIQDQYVENFQDAMNNIKVLTIHERIFLRKAKLMYKVSRKSIPVYLSNIFHQRDADGTPNLRSIRRKNYIIPRPKKELFKKSFQYTGPIIWNNIPSNIRQAPSISSFHNQCLKWMKSLEH